MRILKSHPLLKMKTNYNLERKVWIGTLNRGKKFSSVLTIKKVIFIYNINYTLYG